VSDPQEPATGGTSPDSSRSGADIAESIGRAEAGSAVEGQHERGHEGRPDVSPVEQAAGDPEMTEGQVVLGDGEGGPANPGKDPREAGSGGAQSQPGARVSDRAAAGEPLPDGPPFS